MNSVPNFDRVAGVYRWLEYGIFGPWLSRCRRAFLPRLTGCRRTLVFGDGDGRFTASLLRANRQVKVDAVDGSPAMLKALVRRAGADAVRVRAQLEDARLWRPDTTSDSGLGYDAIFTHFFLDCLWTEELQSLAATVRGAVSPDAVWVVSDFAIPEGFYGRVVARPLIAALYLGFGWVTGLEVRALPDHGCALREAGFALRARHEWLGGLLMSEFWIATAT